MHELRRTLPVRQVERAHVAYRWEPAILQYEYDPTIGASTPADVFRIR